MRYYAVFIPGFEDEIASIIRERLSDVNIIKLVDGAVLFETGCTYDRLNFLCFNNIFALIDILEFGKSTDKSGNGQTTNYPELHMKKALSGILKNFSGQSSIIISDNNKKIKSFRLMFLSENRPVSADEALKQKTENLIAHNSGLRLDRSNPDTEFWFLYRREGFSLFMKRLTNHRINEKSLHKGELSPQLAWLMCCLAELKYGETALDPFCGYGAIALAARKHFPIKMMYASDNDPKCVKYAQSGTGSANTRAVVQKADFRSLSGLIPEKVDAVITDPPWGMYDTEIQLQDFYDEMIAVFSGLIRSSGRAVVLTAAALELESAINRTQYFKITKIISILVSGVKAKVFVLQLP